MIINDINPILFNIHPITIRWYGLFLGFGVIISILLIENIFRQKKLPTQDAYSLSLWMIIGGLLGARLGHVFFYNWEYFSQNLIEIIFINHGGLASHGMAIGILVSLLLFKIIKKKKLGQYLDLIIIPIPLLAFFIRIGNYFNSEIVGKPTDLPWGVWFQRVDANIIFRHPSQIYEALTGLIIFIILYIIYKKKVFSIQYSVLHIFLLLYFSSRFLVEFFKQRHILDGNLSMGQWLSIPFILWSIYWFIKYHIKNKKRA